MSDEYFWKWIYNVQQELLNSGIDFYPETPETLLDQFSRVEYGIKKCMLFHMFKKDHFPFYFVQDIERNPDLNLYESKHGTFVYNTTRLKRSDLIVAVLEDSVGMILGYGIPTVPDSGEITAVIRLVSQEGVEKEAVTCHFGQVTEVTEALSCFYEDGDKFQVQDCHSFHEERMKRFPPID